MTAAKRMNKGTAISRSSAAAKGKQGQANSGEDGRKNLAPVVGIGASAGGLEAITTLLKALSPDLGMAFVLVPHLDPQRESAYTQILARTTSMPVVEIKNGTRVEPNHVYIIPPNCDLTIADSILHIADREEPRVGNTTIDTFMRSLAADQGSKAIGVVLSGTGADGTAGLTAIKGEGGITFAQETHSAKYDGMPASAIRAGCVDFALPPEGIANELARISHHPYVAGLHNGQIEDEDKGAETQMAQVFRLLRRATKVDFSEYKPPTIGRRIQRRMVLHKIEKLGDYVNLLHRDRAEVNALYQDLLINVTSFFRNPEAFDTLKQTVYPAILQMRGPSSLPIRIWVPGCSTGEETYSHAISLVEFLGEERTEVPIQIFGTDLSESAIQRARTGIYKESIEADVNPTRLRRFFHKSDGGYQISKTIRDLCIFSTQNVFSDPPFSRMDLVSCRNVMIYLSQALQRKVIPIFHYALNPTGFLMIGSTEGLLGAGSELFEMADKKQKIYRKKLVSTPVTFGFSIANPQHEAEGVEAPAPPVKPADTVKVPIELQREADRLLLGRYAPPAVVVNDQLEIIQSRGRTGTYLELPPGKASLNLLKMARPGLLFELQNAVDEARRSAVETQRANVQVEVNGGMKVATVRVIPFKTPVQDNHSFLVVFEPTEDDNSEGQPATLAAPLTEAEMSERDKQIGQLKQELAATKEYLQSIIETQEATNEELQSANEEIQSGNEELQSTNEELQTSKEELESANEELHTVNEEMQHRNELLAQLNNDLTNLLNSINLPMVMVGADLSVRRFTPQAATVLGLMSSDVGRPIPRLKLKIDVTNLEQMMLDVIQEVQPKHYRVQDHEGHWCTLRITPYRTLDNRIDGVVLTVLDSSTIEVGAVPVKESRTSSAATKKDRAASRKKSAGNRKR
jgi:two-component system, chemotaxis family, CheB/CheR fusion protein